MTLFNEISDKDFVNRTILIFLLVLFFSVIGLILNFWHPDIAYFNNLTLGNWIFLAEFFGFALVTGASYAYHLFKFLPFFLKKNSQII
jgi:hypothetical protein